MNLFVGRKLTMDEEAYRLRRLQMVDEQIIRRNVRDTRVLEAMRTVPRHLFVADELQQFAYDDCPQPTLSGQTISQPYIVASMTEQLQLRDNSRVLEIGTGSGYQAAVLAQIAFSVFTVELLPELRDLAMATISRLGYSNICFKLGDGSLGWPEEAPFDGILVTAAAAEIPRALIDQLAEGGRLIIPLRINSEGNQILSVLFKGSHGLTRHDLYPVRFVPLCGAGGESL